MSGKGQSADGGDLPGLIRSFERHLRAHEPLAPRDHREVRPGGYAAGAVPRGRRICPPTWRGGAPTRRRGVHRRTLLERFKPGTALTPLPGPAAVLEVVRVRGRSRRVADGEDDAADAPRGAGASARPSAELRRPRHLPRGARRSTPSPVTTPILRLLTDTGMRCRLAGRPVSVDDVDLDDNVAFGPRQGAPATGLSLSASKAARAPSTGYEGVPARGTGSWGTSTRLWLTRLGPMTDSGIRQMVKRSRSRWPASKGLHPHVLRHSFRPRLALSSAAPKATSCAWRVGSHARCCSGTRRSLDRRLLPGAGEGAGRGQGAAR